MRSLISTFGLAALLLAGPACALYGSGDGGGDMTCESSGGYGAAAPDSRDPESGSCVPYQGGPERCAESAPDLAAPPLDPAELAAGDWAPCSSYCDALDEISCALSDGCRAVYVAYPTAGPSGGVRAYAACWAVAPSGPARGGLCEGLDAYECSRRDDCSVVHANDAGMPGPFRSCVAETTCGELTGVPVAPVEYRNPETGTCEYGGGGGGIDPCAGAGAPDEGGGAPGFVPVADWGVCGSPCEGYDETTCKAADGCRAILASSCAPDAPCEPAYAACWPIAPSGPDAPGGCDALGAYDCSRHQDCVAVHAAPPGGDPAWFLACRPE